MTGSSMSGGSGKALAKVPDVGADGGEGSAGLASPPTVMTAAAGSDDHVSEMMGRLRLTAAETEAVFILHGLSSERY
jgi:hypothetical protein